MYCNELFCNSNTPTVLIFYQFQKLVSCCSGITNPSITINRVTIWYPCFVDIKKWKNYSNMRQYYSCVNGIFIITKTKRSVQKTYYWLYVISYIMIKIWQNQICIVKNLFISLMSIVWEFINVYNNLWTLLQVFQISTWICITFIV